MVNSRIQEKQRFLCRFGVFLINLYFSASKMGINISYLMV